MLALTGRGASLTVASRGAALTWDSPARMGKYSRGAVRHVQEEDDARVTDDDRDGQNPLGPDADDVVHMSDPALFLRIGADCHCSACGMKGVSMV